MDKRLVSSQAARHRYLCPGTGINPRVSPASLPEKPSIDAQAGSNPNETNSSSASMIGSCWKREKETEWLCTPPFTPCGTPLGAYSSLVQSKDSQVAFEACDSSMCCHRFSSSRSAGSDLFAEECGRSLRILALEDGELTVFQCRTPDLKLFARKSQPLEICH